MLNVIPAASAIYLLTFREPHLEMVETTSVLQSGLAPEAMIVVRLDISFFQPYTSYMLSLASPYKNIPSVPWHHSVKEYQAHLPYIHYLLVRYLPDTRLQHLAIHTHFLILFAELHVLLPNGTSVS